jgi:hypothetical protein
MSERQQAHAWNCVEREIFITVLAEYGDSQRNYTASLDLHAPGLVLSSKKITAMGKCQTASGEANSNGIEPVGLCMRLYRKSNLDDRENRFVDGIWLIEQSC